MSRDEVSSILQRLEKIDDGMKIYNTSMSEIKTKLYDHINDTDSYMRRDVASAIFSTSKIWVTIVFLLLSCIIGYFALQIEKIPDIEKKVDAMYKLLSDNGKTTIEFEK